MRTAILTLSILLSSCGLLDKTAKVKMSAKVRSAGIQSVALHSAQDGSMQLVAGMVANSDLTIDSYKVPIYRISLVKEISGSGYNGTCGDIYTCSGTEAECLVDLSQPISTDNLLASVAESEVEAEEGEKCEGIAVEFCADGAGGEGNTFNAYIKGSGTLGDTVYYTGGDGLVETAPASEVQIPLGCHGITTRLSAPVKVGDMGSATVVLYADPTGVVTLTQNKTEINSNCLGAETLAICSNWVGVYGVLDDAAPTIERYQLDVTTDAGAGTNFEDMVLTLALDSGDNPFAGTLQAIYPNAAVNRNMHTPSVSLNQFVDLGDGSYDLMYSGLVQIPAFQRKSGISYEMSLLVNTPVTFTSTKL